MAPPPARCLLVLRERVSRDDLDEVRAARGWHLANVVPGSEERPFQMAFLTSDELEPIQFVDDLRSGEQYFALAAPDGRAAAEVSESLPTWSSDDVGRLLQGAVGVADRARALRCLALAGPPGAWGRPHLLEAVEAGLRARAVEVRLAALACVERLQLSELGASVALLAREDEDAGLRASARALLGSAAP